MLLQKHLEALIDDDVNLPNRLPGERKPKRVARNRRQRSHPFKDPLAAGAADPETTMAVFRRVRDEIGEWMKEFMSEAGRA